MDAKGRFSTESWQISKTMYVSCKYICEARILVLNCGSVNKISVLCHKESQRSI